MTEKKDARRTNEVGVLAELISEYQYLIETPVSSVLCQVDAVFLLYHIYIAELICLNVFVLYIKI